METSVENMDYSDFFYTLQAIRRWLANSPCIIKSRNIRDGWRKKGKRQLSQVHKTPFLLSVNSLALAAPPLSTALWSLPLLFSLHLSFPLLGNKSKDITCPTIISPYVVHFHLFPFPLCLSSFQKLSLHDPKNETKLYFIRKREKTEQVSVIMGGDRWQKNHEQDTKTKYWSDEGR